MRTEKDDLVAAIARMGRNDPARLRRTLLRALTALERADGEGDYWRDNRRLEALGKRAARTGESLDDLMRGGSPRPANSSAEPGTIRLDVVRFPRSHPSPDSPDEPA